MAPRILSSLSVLLLTFSGNAFAYQGQDKFLIVSGAYVPSQESYNLDGTGFSASSGPVQGSGLAGLVRWNRSDSSFAIEYLNVDSDHSSPAGITPTSVESKFQRYNFSYRPVLSDSGGGDGFMWNFGLEIRQRSAAVTSPNAFIASHDSMGARFGIDLNFNESNPTYFETQFGLYIPLYNDERSPKTGYYKFSLNPDLRVSVVHGLTETIALSAGLQVFYERIYYSGTGARGTDSGTETFMNIQLPLELRFQF